MLLEDHLNDDPIEKQQHSVSSDLSYCCCLICNDNFVINKVRPVKEEGNNVDSGTAELGKMYKIFCDYMNVDCVTEDKDIGFDFQTEIFPFCKSCTTSLEILLKLHTDFVALQYELNKLVGNLTFKVLETWRQSNREHLTTMESTTTLNEDENIPMNDFFPDSLPPNHMNQLPELDVFNLHTEEPYQSLQEEPSQSTNFPEYPQVVIDGGVDPEKIQKKVSNVRELIFNCFNAKVVVTKLGVEDNSPRPRRQLKIKRPRGRPKKSIQNDSNKKESSQTRPIRKDILKKEVKELEGKESEENEYFSDSNLEEEEDEEYYDEGLDDEEEWLPQNLDQRKDRKRGGRPKRLLIRPKIQKELEEEDLSLKSTLLSNVSTTGENVDDIVQDNVEEGEEENVRKVTRKNRGLKMRQLLKKSKKIILPKRPRQLDSNKVESPVMPTFQRVIEVSPNRFLYRNQFYYEKLPEESKFKCCLCGLLTDHKKAMLDHLRRRRVTSCDQKKLPRCFICEQCGKSFNRKDHFKEHLLTHLDVRSFLCSECGNTFKTKSRLQVHSLIHRGEEAKKYSCEICGKKFLKNSFLKTHALSHTGEKLSECPECHKKFSRRCHMIRHVKSVHVEIKPYGCPVENCCKRYTQSHTLRRHMLVAHFSDGKKDVVNPGHNLDHHNLLRQIPIEEDILQPLPFLPTATLTAAESTGENLESNIRAETSHFLFFPQANFKLN